MSRGSRKIGFAIATLGLVASACTSVNQVAVQGNPLACPEGSACYDPIIPVGPGGSITMESFEFGFRDVVVDATEGPITVVLDNVGVATHNIRIDEAAGETKLVDALPGEVGEGELLLFPGTYSYYCDIPTHRGLGMEGELTIPSQDEYVPGGSGSDMDAESEPSDAPTEAATEAAAPTIEDLDDSERIGEALAGADGLARLYQVSFASGSAELTPEATPVLERLKAAIESMDADKRFAIEGNTDSAGSADANQSLSERRASAVVTWLTDNGVDAARLEAVGNGETNLIIAEDDTPEKQEVNRRVEVRVL